MTCFAASSDGHMVSTFIFVRKKAVSKFHYFVIKKLNHRSRYFLFVKYKVSVKYGFKFFYQ